MLGSLVSIVRHLRRRYVCCATNEGTHVIGVACGGERSLPLESIHYQSIINVYIHIHMHS